jgi:hypothetical protein
MKRYSRLFVPALTDQLKAAGVLSADSGDAANTRTALPDLYVRQVGGWLENSAFDLDCGGTGFVLSVHVAVDMPVFGISGWELDLPWEDRQFQWLADPLEHVPSDDKYQIPGCVGLRYSRDEVLNHRRTLKRGHPLDGLLLGFSFESIPASYRSGATIDASVVLIDEMGRDFSSPVQFWADRSAEISQQRRKKGNSRLFKGITADIINYK